MTQLDEKSVLGATQREGGGLDVDALATRLASGDASTFVIEGLSSRAVARSLPRLKKALEERSVPLIVFDPRSSQPHQRSLEGAVRDFLARVDAESGVDSSLWRLAETIERSAGADAGASRVDGLARMWTSLVAETPAVLLVLDGSEAQGVDAAALEHFARFVYSDPLAALAPEAQSWERPAGAMVFVGAAGFDAPEAEILDFSEDALAAVRSFLAREDVIRRFLDTTAGDVSRLDELVGRLPDNAHHLQLYRFDALGQRERACLEVLAVAGHAIAPDILHDALALVGASEFFARSLRTLEESGFVRKTMGEGRIVVALEDSSFGAAVTARMDAEARCRVHAALADAERVRNESSPDVEFLAQHYLAARESALALEYGASALSRLVARRDHGRARRLIEGLLELAEGERKSALEEQLAGVLESIGDYRAALDACTRIAPNDDAQIAAVALRRGRLLSRVGDYGSALEFFELAAEKGDATARREAVLGRTEAAYSLGLHEEAIAELGELLKDLETSELEPSVRDRAVLSARNTLGKIAMIRNAFAESVEHFEANRELATQWGWDEEVARAQANLGVVALQRDDYGEALDRLEQALSVAGARGSLPRAYCLLNLAAVYQRKGDFVRSLDYSLEAMRCAKKAGDGAAYTVAARNLATTYQDLGAYERAWKIVEHLRDEYESSAQTLAGGWNLFVRGHLLQETGELTKALEVFEELLANGATPVFGAQTRVRLAEIHYALGHEERAKELLDDAAEASEARAKYAALHQLLCAEMLATTDAAGAIEKARAARGVLVDVGAKNDPVRATLVIADALVELGRDAEARTELQRGLGRLREAATLVPEAFQAHFWRKPVHRALVERLQELDGDVPVECLVREAAHAAAAEPLAGNVVTPQWLQWRSRYADIVGEDARLHHVFRLIDKVASSSASVLVYGESGTGKELVASALHRQSERAGKPFVKVNCAAFVENLLLSELFGHEKGAFTGAVEQKIGRFELADGGTIFLDEIGDISPNTQVALLRVLQEGTFERVGGNQTRTVDVRVVCATNKNLEEMVRRGEFRLDLYYRLKGVVIEMPALRQRREDVARLAAYFATRYSADGPKRFSAEALQFLARYSWPGNVRELQNFVRSILLFVDGDVVEMQHIDEFREFFVSGIVDETLPPIDVDIEAPEAKIDETAPAQTGQWASVDPEEALVERIVAEGRSLSDIKKKLEIECIKRALIETGGNVTQAADILQMKRPRLSQIINGDEELTELKSRLTG